MANIRITELDFDEIKQNLKNYLKSQTEFSDYDFEGSGLSVLLDILAYNTHYNAYYMNMVANEMFLDSALKRESAISLAKHLSYVPTSRRAASATVNVQVNNVTGSPATLTMDRYTPFTTTIDGVTYTFSNLEPITITPSNGDYIFENVVIKEGFRVVNTFTSVTPGTQEKFVIPNVEIDTTTLRVSVQTSLTDTTTKTFTQVDDITAITGESLSYFLEQNNNGFYEIFFGDGNLGQKLKAGNIVIVEYLVTSGSDVNVSRTFSPSDVSFALTGSIQGFTNATVSTLVTPTDGQLEESLASIKFNAPRSYTAQNRAVTAKDYEAIIKQNNVNIDSVVVWGGEDNDPPVYGKVFISAIPASGTFITNSVKTNIIDTILGSKKVVSLTPEIVDPDYFYVNVTTNVKYNTTATNLSSTEISNLVRSSIENYFDQNLNNFNLPFTYSKLTSAIDDSDSSIIGNITNVKIQKRFVPSLTSSNNIRIQFNNVLKPKTLETTRFVVNSAGTLVPARIRDDEDAATVEASGTFKRTGTSITITLPEEHNLAVDEEVTLQFSTTIAGGEYTIQEVPTPTTIVVFSPTAGSVSGTVNLTSRVRGSLVLYNPLTEEVLNNNVGFVNYQEGIVFIQNLRVFGFPNSATDVRLTIGVDENSKDISVFRNQIILLDDSESASAINRNAGLTISTTSVAL